MILSWIPTDSANRRSPAMAVYAGGVEFFRRRIPRVAGRFLLLPLLDYFCSNISAQIFQHSSKKKRMMAKQRCPDKISTKY
jgi:hypothetical protein